MDRNIIIHTATTRKTKVWKKENINWFDFIDRLKVPVRSTESLAEYVKLPKAKQDDLKDVGGFIAGDIKDGKRKNSNLISRDLITLDLDNIEAGKTEDVINKVDMLGMSYVIYSTRKHSGYKPRLRIIVPTDRSMNADEYEPCARLLASYIGINMCDPTTFEPVRLMFWPSISSDSQYVYSYTKTKGFTSVDGLLAKYKDWRNVEEWPKNSGQEKIINNLLKKQENPLEKTGIIGAFCKTFNITEAVEKFLPGIYEATDLEDRLTYIKGSTANGAVIYDDIFLYSHHATDPAGQKLCNAFDLVRIHLYGDLDVDAKDETPVNKLPSFVEMSKFAKSIKDVANILNRENYKKLKSDFGTSEEFSDDEIEWIAKLTTDKNGNYRKTIANIVLILDNDTSIKSKFALDEFANRAIVRGAVPWRKTEYTRDYEEVDDSSLRNYLERVYGITGEKKVYDALLIVSHKNKVNQVKEYLENLKWDGVKRVEMLLVDYLGSEDNIYTRDAIKIALCAAVARACEPIVKYDYMPIFTGKQGIGKSTFLATLGKQWFSDSLQSFEGKESAEMIQGTWINEIGELAGMNKSETEMVKQFLSKKEDIYREPYGRRTSKYPRRCVFFGTSNEWDILKDKTGNRRFWPIEVGKYKPKKSIWDDLPNELDQIWAEAYHIYYKIGQNLMLDGEALALSEEAQANHQDTNFKEGLIVDFINKKIPKDWSKWELSRRKMFWEGSTVDELELVDRTYVCAVEIYVELFKGDVKYMRRQDSVEINSILNSVKTLKRIDKARRFGFYGVQKGFLKI